MKSFHKLLLLSVLLASHGVAFAAETNKSDASTVTIKKTVTTTTSNMLNKPVANPVSTDKPIAVTAKTSNPVEPSVAPTHQPDLSVTLGFKVWANEWQTWNDPKAVNLGPGSFGSANAIAPNPSLTVKYKNAFISGGFMPSRTYDIPGSATGSTTTASRKEMDLSVGYYIHPQVALTAGYKQITQTWDNIQYVWKIPAIGISTSAAIQNTMWFMYGSAAVGYSTISTSDSTAWYWAMKGGVYTTSEIGMGYSISRNFRLTGGYKYQSSPTSMEAWKTTTRVTFIDSTRGFVFGGSYTF